jgi:5-methylcytosine-specific restriction endonuclease McrA
MVTEARKEYVKKWYEKNKEHVLKYQLEYYHKNRERDRERRLLTTKKWGIANKEYRKEYFAKYRLKNKEKIADYNKMFAKTERGRLSRKTAQYNYKQSIRGLRKSLNKNIVQQVYEDNIKKYGTLTCDLCLKPVLFGQDSIEHFIPITRGGTNERFNLGIAHGTNSIEKCNVRKSNKTLEEWIKVC